MAVNLYERNDSKVINRAAVVPHELIRYTREVLLVTTPVCTFSNGAALAAELCVSQSIAEPEPGVLGQGLTLRTPA